MKYIEVYRMIKQAVLQKQAEDTDAEIGSWSDNANIPSDNSLSIYPTPGSYAHSLTTTAGKAPIPGIWDVNATKAFAFTPDRAGKSAFGQILDPITQSELKNVRTYQAKNNSANMFPFRSRPQKTLQAGLEAWGQNVNYPQYLESGKTPKVTEDDMSSGQAPQILGPDFMKLFWKADPNNRAKMLWMLNNQVNNNRNVKTKGIVS